MKIDTNNFLGDRFSSISDINRLIYIDYIDWYRLYQLLVFIDWARREKIYARRSFIAKSYPSTANFVKNTSLRVVCMFNSLLGVWISLSLVFDILRLKCLFFPKSCLPCRNSKIAFAHWLGYSTLKLMKSTCEVYFQDNNNSIYLWLLDVQGFQRMFPRLFHFSEVRFYARPYSKTVLSFWGPIVSRLTQSLHNASIDRVISPWPFKY